MTEEGVFWLLWIVAMLVVMLVGGVIADRYDRQQARMQINRIKMINGASRTNK